MSENEARNNTPLFIALIVIAVLLLCCCLIVAGLAIGGILSVPWSVVTDTRVEATEKLEKTFDVSAPASLEVDVNVGDVVIQAGDSDEVRVHAAKHAWGKDRQQAESYLDDFKVWIRQRPTGEIEIESEMPRRLQNIGRTPSLNLRVTVPRDTRLDLVVKVGDVEATGIRGAFEIECDVGDVTLRDVRFEEDSRIESGVGDIELRLPPNSAFAFSAKSGVGDIRVDFAIQNDRTEKKVVGGSVEGEIGASPTAHVELETGTGDIKIRKE